MIREERIDIVIIRRDFNDIVCRFDGVETSLTDLKYGVCLKKGVEIYANLTLRPLQYSVDNKNRCTHPTL